MPFISGTARLVDTTWLILNDADIDRADKGVITDRHSFLERDDDAFSYSRSLQPRITKTHLSYKYVENVIGRCKKIIIGVRNPKDNLISNYHFHTMNHEIGPFNGTFDEFFEVFKAKKLVFGDFFDFYLSWWPHRHRENIMFVHYEDFSADPEKVIRDMATFLDKDLDKEQVQDIAQWVDFSNMKKNASTNYSHFPKDMFRMEVSPYMRAGTTGQWKGELSKGQNEYIEAQCRERCDPVGLTFRWE